MYTFIFMYIMTNLYIAKLNRKYKNIFLMKNIFDTVKIIIH